MAEVMAERVERWAVKGLARVRPNVGATERLLTGAAGAVLMAVAMRQLWKRWPMATASSALLARAATGYCPVYEALGVEPRSTRELLSGKRGVHLHARTTVARPPQVVYKAWRDLEMLAQAISGRARVEVLDERRSRWKLMPEGGDDQAAPLAEWTAEIINDVQGRLLAWQTTTDADVASAGTVTFEPVLGGNGTDVRLHVQWAPPMGRFGAALASLDSRVNPSDLAHRTLNRLKETVERGFV